MNDESSDNSDFISRLPPESARQLALHTMTILTMGARLKEAGTMAVLEAQMTPSGSDPDPRKSAAFFRSQADAARTLSQLQSELAEAFDGAAKILDENFASPH